MRSQWVTTLVLALAVGRVGAVNAASIPGSVGAHGTPRASSATGRSHAGMSLPTRVAVYPAEINLASARAYRQLVVMGFFGAEARDLTHEAAYRVSNARVARLEGTRVLAAGNGQTTITVVAGGRTIQVPVAVTGFEKPDPIRFKFETVAVLTKQGCANGSCHGSPHGKGGFSLSLFGYDPRIDRISLTRDGFNRRVNIMDPNESLMIKKPLLEIPHVGGKRLHKTDAAYNVLTRWIYEGANTELPNVDCRRIAVFPDTSRVLHSPALSQQISVLATYSDGSARDVSAIASYESSSPNVASVDADGLVTGHARGQTAISVRYLDKVQSIYFTVVEDVPGFAWKQPRESNFVDRLVDAKLKQLQYLPSTVCADPVFLRRVYLDLTGLLPTADITRAFLKDTAPGKRSALVASLLNSEEYARFWALKKADLMRVSPNRLQDGRADLFAEWIVDAFRKNMPYDQFAREILTAAGDTRKVAQANFFLAVPTMEERTEMTTEIFMGSRVECAHCHNHPFEKWTMRDYYSIGAVFARTKDENGRVMLASSGEVQLPTTREVMAPYAMPAHEKGPESDRRAAFADWLTAPENPLFARVEINRIWADLFGHGIVDPVDDFRSSNPPSNVPLLDGLAEEFRKSGYDRKHMIRLICESRETRPRSRSSH